QPGGEPQDDPARRPGVRDRRPAPLRERPARPRSRRGALLRGPRGHRVRVALRARAAPARAGGRAGRAREGDGAVQQRRAGEEGEDPRRGVAARFGVLDADLEAEAPRHPAEVRGGDRVALRMTRFTHRWASPGTALTLVALLLAGACSDDGKTAADPALTAM